MNTARSLRDKLARGETVLGVWAALPDAFAAELMCVDGVDYICVDQQHGLVDYGEMVEMLRAIEPLSSKPRRKVIRDGQRQ